MFEVEQKYPIDDEASLAAKLKQLGFQAAAIETHRDTYYNHPCRDFAQSKEALRVRRIDGAARITYKGSKLPGAIKARRELEWELGPGDAQGDNTEALLQHLGFRRVAEVGKTRQRFHAANEGDARAGPRSDLASADLTSFTVVIDDVDEVGRFVEIERLAETESAVAAARERIAALADQLDLHQTESRSYLTMLLENRATSVENATSPEE
ncbi:MAG: class IV adenylate cyclase [Novipirellula sp. JB048]